MPENNNRRQLRRCGMCQKIGHNKSTCSEIDPPASLPAAKPASSPVKFFVYHLPGEPKHSSHLINLKERQSPIWNQVETEAAAESKKDPYYFYHELPVAALPEKRLNKLAALPPPAPLLLPRFELPRSAPPVEPPQRLSARRGHFTQSLHDVCSAWFNQQSARVASLLKKPLGIFSLDRVVFTAAFVLVALLLPNHVYGYYHSLQTTKRDIVKNSTDGFMALQESTVELKQARFAEAHAATITAVGRFNNATTVMEENHRFLQSVLSAIPVVRGEVMSRQRLLLGGQEIALGNAHLLQGITAVQTNASSSFNERITTVHDSLAAALPNYNQALTNLEQADSTTLPLQYQASFNDFRSLFKAVINDFNELAELSKTFQEIFGGGGRRRYIVIFQNPHELRATGGFMGSFAVIEVKDGKIISMDVPAGGSYNLQGQLDTFIEPPTPLFLSNKRWEFQDANWFPDFPASAEKILWFYRHSRGVTADGVIAVNATVLERLLTITGPVRDEKRGLTLTADDALTNIQTVVEQSPEKKQHKPKQILTDLAPELIERFKTAASENTLPLFLHLQEALQQKEVQVYLTDTAAARTIDSFGWSGKILPAFPGQDYLMVVNSNIQGAKSDAKIKQLISHQTVIEDDGRIVNTVTITREHTGNKEEKLYGATNIDYLRLYVPQGSKLLSAAGFTWPDEKAFRVPESWYKKDETLLNLETVVGVDTDSGTRITNEFGKTSFGNWVITMPGETSQIQFTYQLPFTASSLRSPLTAPWKETVFGAEPSISYQLIVQRQSGSESLFESQIILPDAWQPSWKDNADMRLAANGGVIDATPLRKDTLWSLLATKK